MNVGKNKIIMFFIVVSFFETLSSSIVPAAMENAYKGAVAQLSQAKKSIADYFSSYINEEEVVTKKITVTQAIMLMQQLIDAQPHDAAMARQYWQSKSSTILRCARILHEASTRKILKTLQEINRRWIYWLYQKEHPWYYFFGKNPFKWIMGKKQNVEITTNIDQLEKKQNELYIRLGELSNIDWHEYLLAFNNYQASYAWVEKLFVILSGKKEVLATSLYGDNYGAVAVQLKKELQKVNSLTETILASLADTAVPHHIMRNWIWYGGLMIVSHFLYNSPEVSDFVKSLPNKSKQFGETVNLYLGKTKDLVNTILFGSKGDADFSKLSRGLFVQPATKEETRKSLERFLNESVKTGILGAGTPIATEDEKIKILTAFDNNDTGPLETFFGKALSTVSKVRSSDYLVSGFYNLMLAMRSTMGSNAEAVFTRLLDQLNEETQGLRYLALLAPAFLTVLGGYRGYQRLAKYDYTSIRLALLAINGLFVDKTKPLDDLEYGKMIYLLYNIKEMAEKDLPVRGNVRNDFIHDLERIESREYDSAAKRRIIKDMFKKYNFLGLIQ